MPIFKAITLQKKINPFWQITNTKEAEPMPLKNKCLILLGLTILTALSTSTVCAETYLGGNVAILDYSEVGVPEDASLTTLYGRLGTSLNENFSAEIRVGFGLGDDTIDVFGLPVDVELKNFFGGYLLAGFDAGAFYPCAILGYTRSELEASAFGISASETESDASFGFGADFYLSRTSSLNLEYMNYIDVDSVEIYGFGIGLSQKF